MFFTIQAHEYDRYAQLINQSFRLRKKVFADELGWRVPVNGPYERDEYDALNPVYLVWTNKERTRLYGCLRLMPTTGPTLLYDVFRDTFPQAVDLVFPGIWEGTRMCVDSEALARDYPQIEPSTAFCMLLLALCECALSSGIHTMICNYEPHLKRIYKRAGLVVQELGRAEGYGKHPVCCGSFEVSKSVLVTMRQALCIQEPLYRKATYSQTSTPHTLGYVA